MDMGWKNQLIKTPYLVLFIVLIAIGVGTASALITITLDGFTIFKEDVQMDKNLNVDGQITSTTTTEMQNQILDLQSALCSAEICNNVDDNCDGSIDESLVMSCGSNVGACSEGTSVCGGGVFGDCIGEVGPTTEICNSVDDNCDGFIDEGLSCP